MKKFDIPDFYKSNIIAAIKELRKSEDPLKKDFTPTALDFGPIKFLIARHFGFCYGVENAVEIVYKIIEQSPEKKIFLISELIHNQVVNLELQSRGVKFIMDISGNQQVNWEDINSSDVVIVPAFGTTREVENILLEKGIDAKRFNTTCPFVERVWNKAAELGRNDYTVIIHGKTRHEETRATYSHSTQNAPTLIIRGIEEAKFLSDFILGKKREPEFNDFFKGKYSDVFNAEKDLQRIGVVNQTTMLAVETQEIADLLRETMIKKYGEVNLKEHFADTRDTLCYATNDNQSATMELLNYPADFAVVVGGYNSSNTSHLVEILQEKHNTFFISGEDKIISKELISYFDIKDRKEKITENYFPSKDRITITVTSGASCPDSVIDEVLNKLLSFFNVKKFEDVLGELNK
jgi:4-hydroxy-3-methylbut-2-en-1-yl diphosphate reductase